MTPALTANSLVPDGASRAQAGPRLWGGSGGESRMDHVPREPCRQEGQSKAWTLYDPGLRLALRLGATGLK